MKSYRFKALLQQNGWLENVTISLDDAGKIAAISQNETPDAIRIEGCALPGFQNAHSHAFQYAMAGLAENHAAGGETDDFWSWRETMYKLALEITPEQMKTIAAMLYRELLRHGYTNVAEFHYVHHDKSGAAYENPAAMGEALCEAARESGIKITLVPIFYQKGGFNQPPNERQRRFISPNFEDYWRLFEATAKVCQRYENANVAVGVHSLRGVEAADVVRVAREMPQNIPFHIHIAEQLKEVEDSLRFLGKRPVEWLLDNIDLNDRFHLVHATHLTETETERLAKTGANVVLCPSTEGNLGDGIFPLRSFQAAGGNWSVGTDSHVSLNFFEELRLLDYGQRLTTHRRDTFRDDKISDAGLYAINKATFAGRRAMNDCSSEFFPIGAPFDACIIKADEPLLANVKPENMASTIVYSTDAAQIYGTFVSGKLIRKDEKYEQIKVRFIECMNDFRNSA